MRVGGKGGGTSLHGGPSWKGEMMTEGTAGAAVKTGRGDEGEEKRTAARPRAGGKLHGNRAETDGRP